MGPPPVSMVLVVVLILTATLPGPTMVYAEGCSVPDEDTTTTTTTTTRVDNQCSPLRKRQDLLDNRMNERDSDLNSRLNEVNSRFNTMESRLDGIETGTSKDQLSFLLQPGLQNGDFRPPKISQVHQGCQEALTNGWTTSGVYSISPDHDKIIDVYCEQQLDGGGWMVFQARKDGSVDFYQNWNTYKQGFGELSGEFWLGNTKIHLLTKHHDQQLKIELMSPEGEVKYAEYAHFSIADEADKYRLNVTGYSGGSPPGDSMAYHQGHQFSTRDQDNDLSSGSCAKEGHAGWWYNKCNYANLNGLYRSKEHNEGLNWETWKGNNLSMKATRMMIRKKP